MQQGGFLQYNFSHKPDIDAKQLPPRFTAALHCTIWLGTHAAHAPPLGWGPAAWMLNKARKMKKQLQTICLFFHVPLKSADPQPRARSDAEYVGNSKSAAVVILEYQEAMGAVLNECTHGEACDTAPLEVPHLLKLAWVSGL